MRISRELLAMTQRVDPHPVRVDLAGFLAEQAARHKEIAVAKGLTWRCAKSRVPPASTRPSSGGCWTIC